MGTFVSNKRILVRYAEEGGNEKAGIIEIRKGLKDINIGKKQYSMVRIPVGSRWYIKGMAMYSNDIPEGFDIVYYTSKPKGTPLKTSPKKASNAVFKFDRDNIHTQFETINYDVMHVDDELYIMKLPPSYMSNLVLAEHELRLVIRKIISKAWPSAITDPNDKKHFEKINDALEQIISVINDYS